VAVHRISWPTVAAAGSRVGRCILIAGLPWAIVPEGQTITSVSWTDTADAAWHAGTSPTCKAWLLMQSEHDTSVPALAWEENASPVQGTVDVGSLRFWLADGADAPTLTLGARDAQVFTRLVGDHSASATTITVESTVAFGASGTIHIGRERITYSGKTGTTFTGCARGTAGTDARKYVASGALFRVYEAGTDERLPTLTGRRCTVWLFALSSAGVATDPTLVYDGRIASGAGVVDNSAWEIAVEHALNALDAECQAPTLSLYGYSHGTTRRATNITTLDGGDYVPLVSYWTYASGTRQLTLNTDTATPDSDGWSESREQYIERWNRASTAGSYGIYASLEARGILRVSARDAVNDRRLVTWHGWAEANTFDPPDPTSTRETATTYSTGGPMPRACLWMIGKMPLPPSERSKIPTPPTYPLTDSTTAHWTLTAKCVGGEMTSQIRGLTDAGADPLVYDQATGLVPVGVQLTGLTEIPEDETPVNPYLITKPCSAKLGLLAQGPTWWSTLRYAVLDQIDTLRGTDQLSDSIDWSRIEALGRRQAPHPTTRVYTVDIEAPFLDLFRNEAALNGLALSTWHGRAAMCAIREAAPTEARSGSLTAAYLRRGEVATVREVTDGLATSYQLHLPAPSEDTITVNDAGAIAESGAGETIEATLPGGVLPDGVDVATPALQATVIDVASALLAPWVRPYQVASWPGDLRLAGHQIGDVCTLEEWLLPDQQGGRGLDGIVGTVLGRRVDFDEGTVDLRLRLSPSTVAGYAPSALVSSITGAAVTLDTATVATCGFADPYQDDGSARTDGGASYFVAGDKVELIEIDSESPTTPFVGEVLSVAGSVVTLTSSPGGTWEALAVTATKVMLVPDDWSTCTAAQRRYAYQADAATFQLPSSTAGRRWV
jgi:hypothetical protein